MEMPLEHVLYPGGGNFNKLRTKQIFLEQLLKDNVEGYISSNSKREFVKENVLDKIPGGLKVFSKETGKVYQPDEHEAFDRVSQKIRDIKKYRLKAANLPPGSRKVSQKKTTAPVGRRRRDTTEENVKEKLILEMRAEITRLRANVMTAHEKIRTLEQLHSLDEERIQQLLDELGVKKGPEAVARVLASSAALASAAAVGALAAAVKDEDDNCAEVILEPLAEPAVVEKDETRKHKAEETPMKEPPPKRTRKKVTGVGAVAV